MNSKLRLVLVLIVLALSLMGCWPVPEQTPRPLPDNQKQAVECAFARLNCDPSWGR